MDLLSTNTGSLCKFRVSTYLGIAVLGRCWVA